MAAVSAEYFALQGLRASSIGEASSRAALFFTTITGVLIALGLLATSLGTKDVDWAAILAAPVVGFIGLTSFLRIVETTIEDVAALRAMNVLREWLAGSSPQASRLIQVPGASGQHGNAFLVTGAHENPWRITITLGSAVGTVNSAQSAVVLGLLAIRLGTTAALGLAIGGALGGCLVALHLRYQVRRYQRAVDAWRRMG